MQSSGDERSRQIQSLIQEFLEQHPEPTREHEESLCSQHPDLAPLLRELLPRVRGLTAAQTREQIEKLVTHDTQVAGATVVSGEASPPSPEKPWVPGADTVADATLPGKSAKPLFDNRYRVVRTIGQGGFGRVDLVEDTLRRNERVALKVILPKHADTKEFEARFQNEISVLRALRHEGIPQIFNDGRTSEGGFYYTMEFVDGTPLEDVLEREKRLGPRRIVRLVRQITNILEYAHSQGVVHRDLKPNNIVLVNEGTDDEQAKVLDFGIAKILRKEGMLEYAETMNTLGGMGTPHYMSPEQVRGKEVDGSTDFYALGVIIYRMVSSRFPFKGKTPMEIATTRIEQDAPPLETGDIAPQELTTQLATLVKGLLEREKEKRPDAEWIRRHLVLEGMASEQRRFHRFGRRVVAVLAAVIVALVGYFAWKGASGQVVAGGTGNPSTPEKGDTPSPEQPEELPRGPEPAALVDGLGGPVSSPFTFSGRARNIDRVLVRWDGGERELAVDDSEVFRAELALPDGEHEVRVLEPGSGSELARTTVFVDGTPPEITLQPLPGNAVEQDGETVRYVHQTPVEIRGAVRDASPGTLAGLELNARELEASPDGSFSLALFERVGKDDERATAVLVARDEAGNETEERLVFLYDGSPPEIRFSHDDEVWSGDRVLEIATDEVGLDVVNADGHAVGLFLDGEEVATEGEQASVVLTLGDADERTYSFRATDLSGRESQAEVSVSRKLALTSLTLDDDPDALRKQSITTPRESITVAGRLNRPAERVEIALGSGTPVPATLTDSGTGFEAHVGLAEGSAQNLRLLLDGREAGTWSLNWQPPLVPEGLVRIGNEGLEGRAKYAVHEATGMQFVLVPPAERPYVFGDVQVDVNQAFYIGTTEVTWSQFTASGLEYEDQRFWTKIDDPNPVPMVGVSFATAVAYCDWIDLDEGTVRLPTEAEWLHAAGGPETPTYPWGEEWDAARCHSREGGERHPVAVTVHADAASWCGATGFAGNVSEWCTRADGSPVLRGGSWAAGPEGCQLTERPAFRGEGGKNTVGFRIVIVPE